MANRYDVGDMVEVSGTWTDPENDDAAMDPDDVYCSVRSPDGVVTTYQYDVDDELVRDSEGVYYVRIDVDQSGRWYYRWYSTGTGQAAEENYFNVNVVHAV